MKKFIANNNDNGVRLNRFCEKVCPNIPKSMLQKAFRNKRIKVNGKKQLADYRIVEGDVLELYINDEFFTNQGEKIIDIQNTTHKSMPSIIYQDENILLAFKPVGLLCHSDNKNELDLVTWFRNLLINTGEYSPEQENTFSPSICNRLDQGTEGIVICAKNYASLRDMNLIIKDNLIDKIYLCVAKGGLEDGEYNAFHKRDTINKKVIITKHQVADSKNIITSFKTINSKDNISLIEVTLKTGRTHQIRAHLAFLGCPILGDSKYGVTLYGLRSQLLTAYKLNFKEISKENTLSYLSNKTFTSNSNSVTKYFNKL